MRRQILLTGVALSAAACAVLVAFWPTGLEVNLNQPVSEYQAQSGQHDVTFRLLRDQTTGDSGLLEIQVWVNGQQVKTLPASYSYDTLKHQPAGQFRRVWLDGDLWPDVQLEPNGFGESAAFYIGSRDGGFYARGSQ